MAMSNMPPSREGAKHQAPPRTEKPWYLSISVALALVLGGLLSGLIVGFVWATSRDAATLAMNGREIAQLTAEAQRLRREVAQLSLNQVPQHNWWGWWLSLPARHLWNFVHFW